MGDRLQKFLFENASVRGELVDLKFAWEAVQKNHNYPLAVQRLLGEMLAASILLASNIKFNGSLIMQIQGDGPLKLLVAECNSDMKIRATAKIADGAIIHDNATIKELVHANGKGRFVITLDMSDKVPGQPPYQGIVSLEGETLSEIIESYMAQSEQLQTKIWLAANDSVSRGFLLQKLPEKTGEDGLSQKSEAEEEKWEHILALSSTLKADEILSTDMDTLRYRLFWNENLILFDPVSPEFSCRCSRQKVSDMLKMLGEKEVTEALEEQKGQLTVHCDFCGEGYTFDSVDIGQLFSLSPLKH